MAPKSSGAKLIAVVGPTAVGKTDLAIKIAKEFNGEIIAVDSRTIYKDMNVGTAKPTPQEQSQIPHWGLDLVEPGQAFSAAQFKKYAKEKIRDIQKRNKLPILVGGTGLYIDGVLFDFGFVTRSVLAKRARLEKMKIEELQAIIRERGYTMPRNDKNPRHLIRTIERQGQIGTKRLHLLQGVILIGLMPPAETVKHRIKARAQKNFEDLIEETKVLLVKYDRQALVKTGGIPYQAAMAYLDGKLDKTATLQRISSDEWQYARRQRTWFRRNPYIKWFDSAEEALKAFKSGKIKEC